MFDSIVAWDNLWLAYRKAAKGKRGKTSAARFEYRLTVHETAAQVQPTATGIPWLGFIVFPAHRRLKRRNGVNFQRRFRRNLDAYRAGQIPFAELDASVQGWINHVRYADTWGLRRAILAQSPLD